MSVSGDYDVSTRDIFKDAFDDLVRVVDADTVVKSMQVMIEFQTSQPGRIWGETLEERASNYGKVYPATLANVPSDTELLAAFKIYPLSKLEHDRFKEIIELLSRIELDKYPILLEDFCQMIREIEDEELFNLIQLYQFLLTSQLPDEDPKKIEAKQLLELELNTAQAQALIASARQTINESSSIDLYRKVRDYVLTAVPLINQLIEAEIKSETKVVDSPLAQLLIASSREEMRKQNLAAEIKKVASCYQEAISDVKTTYEVKQFSSVEIKVVYTKRPNMSEEFFYTTKCSIL